MFSDADTRTCTAQPNCAHIVEAIIIGLNMNFVILITMIAISVIVIPAGPHGFGEAYCSGFIWLTKIEIS